MHRCGCLTVVAADPVAVAGAIDVDGQLELLRQVLRHVALAAPDVDLDLLANDLFGGQKVLAEHYLWRLELDGFIAHPDERPEQQTALLPTKEGSAALLMLELTKPDANADALSPRLFVEAAAAAEPTSAASSSPRMGGIDIDVPRFLTARERR